ncbi:TetR/AcrR family transcriptional regulator C-terminal domain-containing protein [Lysobacter arenosi]|uniref:TetR/AcrR family transcriptional regulator C-terminal domain-containing protein n=1 Tax=Lysobacter arenosi TaxID=2795387 RepID=A0ABX7R7U8_9GAMM|nr:TetR/AcrR family transcriptional regulator C-terminal domain-containing protein [Lysobacter arenosi]QSX74193.1 TetR/AcrR family transcriptional regulator C-terminal domain-containing protein [Lysobacter arenosi]
MTTLFPRSLESDQAPVARIPQRPDLLRGDGVPEELAIEVDANGSPVTIEAATWLICFVPGLRRQWWHRFADARHKHVFALREVGDGTWLLVEPWWTRMMVNVLTVDEATKFLRWAGVGDILQVRESIPGCGSQMRGWSNCSVQMAYLLGRSYRTWTPNGLYRRLLREPDTRRVDASTLLKKHFQFVANRTVNMTLRAIPRRRDESLDATLLALGTGVMTAMTSISAIGLYKVVVSDSSRFQDAADMFWALGPGRAIGRVREALEDARHRGEIDVDDCHVAALEFMAMLRGNLYLETVFGLRGAPAASEIGDHVRSVIAVFLHGARPAVGSGGGRADFAMTGAICHSGLEMPPTHALTAAGLIREIGESAREIVDGNDWQQVAGWAEAVWRGYSNCTGLPWEQASARIHDVWKATGYPDRSSTSDAGFVRE